MNYNKYLRANALSFIFIGLSLLMISSVMKKVWTYWQHNAFLPGMEDVLAHARERQDPSLCNLTTSPTNCLEHLLHPTDDDRTWDPYRASYNSVTPLKFDCASISDADIQVVCEVTVEKKFNRNSCENLQNLFAKDDCLKALAVQMKDVNICDEVVPTVLPSIGSDTQEWKEAIRANCIHEVAVEMRDPTLCNRLANSYRREDCARYIPKKGE